MSIITLSIPENSHFKSQAVNTLTITYVSKCAACFTQSIHKGFSLMHGYMLYLTMGAGEGINISYMKKTCCSVFCREALHGVLCYTLSGEKDSVKQDELLQGGG